MASEDSEDELVEGDPSADEKVRSATPMQNKTVRACETCRAQKARCVPSSMPGKCQKCLQLRKPCIQHVPKKRARTSKRSLARVEQKIENIYQLLEGRTAGQINIQPNGNADLHNHQYASGHERLQQATSPALCRTQSSQKSQSGPSCLAPTAQHTSPQTHQLPTPVSNTDPGGDRVLAATMLGLTDSGDFGFDAAVVGGHLLQKLGAIVESFEQDSGPLRSLEVATALKLVATFRTMMPYFPFITLPGDLSLERLMEERPMSILASLTVSSTPDEELHRSCNSCFRQTLARKVLVNGEKSLDLLQSILIYMAWYHHYFCAQTQNIYQYIQLACGMAIDLGFFRKATQQHFSDSQLCGPNLDTKAPTPEGDDVRDLEGRRALIGCYYLSCGLSVLGMGKPANLAFTDHLRQCGIDVAEQAYYTSDKALLPCADLLHIAEEVQRSLRDELPANILNVSDEVRVKASLKRAESQLQQWREQHLPEAQDYWGFSLTYNYVEMYLYESALSINAFQGLDKPSSMVSCSHTQLSMLLSAVQATKKLFDDLFAQPTYVFTNMAMVEWTHIIAAVVLMAKLSRPLPGVIGWEVEEVRGIAKVEEYIDRLIMCMEIEGDADRRCHHVFMWATAVCGNIKRWVSVANQPQGAQELVPLPLPDRTSTAEFCDQFQPAHARPQRSPSAHQGSHEMKIWSPTEPGNGGAVAFPTQSPMPPGNYPGMANQGLNPNMDIDELWNDFILNYPHTFWDATPVAYHDVAF